MHDPHLDHATILTVASYYKHKISEALDAMSIADVRQLVTEMEAEAARMVDEEAIRTHAADALRRARALPVGPDRNDLRQVAIGLMWLDRKRV